MSFVIPKIWVNSVAVCVASGPSLSNSELELCKDKGYRFIVVNDNYTRAPWADILYAADNIWWRNHRGVKGFHGLKISIEEKSKEFGNIKIVKNLGNKGLSLDSTGLMTGHNSGYQAINLAFLLGSKKIILLGYDMREGKDRKNHWFGEHEWKKKNPNVPYDLFLREFPSIVGPLKREGVEVINCNLDSSLECFKKISLSDVLL